VDDLTTAERHPATPSTDPGTPLRPPPRSTSLRPAALVGGIGVLILAIFAVGSAIVGGSHPPKLSVKNTVVAGTSLRAEPATTALRPIEQGGEPPANIVDAVPMPGGYSPVSTANNTAAAGQYDEQVRFSINASEEALFRFYKVELPKLGWRVESTGPAKGQPGVEVIAQKGGSDGWYWEFGAIISPTTFAKQPPTSQGTASRSLAASDDVTRFTLRLFQVPDAA
jgi:hypothetical protein